MRCACVDLYFTLYGRRRPPSLPIPELAALGQPTKPMVGQPRRDKDKKQFVIPKTEKARPEPDLAMEMSGPIIKQEIVPMGEVGEVYFETCFR